MCLAFVGGKKDSLEFYYEKKKVEQSRFKCLDMDEDATVCI